MTVTCRECKKAADIQEMTPLVKLKHKLFSCKWVIVGYVCNMCRKTKYNTSSPFAILV